MTNSLASQFLALQVFYSLVEKKLSLNESPATEPVSLFGTDLSKYANSNNKLRFLVFLRLINNPGLD